MPQASSIGTGFCIDRKKKRFITNAHCVDHAVLVQVLKRGDTKKHVASVSARACGVANRDASTWGWSRRDAIGPSILVFYLVF